MTEPVYYADLRSAMRVEPWCLDSIEVEGDTVTASGWAIPVGGEVGRGIITFDGTPAFETTYGIPRIDVRQIYAFAPNSELCGFTVKGKLSAHDWLEMCYSDAKTCEPYCDYHSYFLPLFEETVPIPDDERRRRTTGNTTEATFKLGGFTLAMKIHRLLQSRLHSSLSEFNSILDWGGGCGRLSRYLLITPPEGETLGFGRTQNRDLTIADIDESNIRWTAETLPGIHGITLPLFPPSSLPGNVFDLVIGNSVFTHLRKDAQFAWLEELHRVTKKGGIVLVTIHSIKDLMRATQDAKIFGMLFREGIIDEFPDSSLDGYISDSAYYRATFHTHDYVRSQWANYFDVVDLVPDFSNNHQDMVIMRKR